MEAVWRIEVEDFPRSSSSTTRATTSSPRSAAPSRSAPEESGTREVRHRLRQHRPLRPPRRGGRPRGRRRTSGLRVRVGRRARRRPRDYASTYRTPATARCPGARTSTCPTRSSGSPQMRPHHDAAGGDRHPHPPQRNPVVLARRIATLDVLSGGRVQLGVGIGWLREEFEVLGASFPDRARRTEGTSGPARCGGRRPASRARPCRSPTICRPPTRRWHRPITSAATRRRRPPGRPDRRRLLPGQGRPPRPARRAARGGRGRPRPRRHRGHLVGDQRAEGRRGALDEVARLADMGVDRLVLPPLSYDPAAIGDALASFGEQVIAPSQG